MKVAVLGGGAWGGVLAAVASARGHDVALLEGDPAAAVALRRKRSSRRSVPGFRLPDAVAVSADAEETVSGRPMVVIALPQEVAAVLFDGKPARAALTDLLARDVRPERA